MLRGLYIIDNGSKPGFGFDFDFYGFAFDTYVGDQKDNRYEFDNFSGSVFTPLSVGTIPEQRLNWNGGKIESER